MVRTILTLAAFWLGNVALAQNGRIPSPGSGQPSGAVPGGVPVIPTGNPQSAFAKLPKDLQDHLVAWEKRSSSLQTLYTTCERVMKNAVTQKTVDYSGTIYCMKPNLAYLRIDNSAKKDDFSSYICDGKNVYEYSGADKTMRQHPIPPGGKGNVGDNLLLEFMSGAMTATDVADRFKLKLIKEDQNYVYIEVLPTIKKDMEEFETMIIVLFNGKVKGLEYMPAKVRMTRGNNQEIDEWTFKQPMPNAAGIKKENFKYVEPPRDWQKKLNEPQPRVSRP